MCSILMLHPLIDRFCAVCVCTSIYRVNYALMPRESLISAPIFPTKTFAQRHWLIYHCDNAADTRSERTHWCSDAVLIRIYAYSISVFSQQNNPLVCVLRLVNNKFFTYIIKKKVWNSNIVIYKISQYIIVQSQRAFIFFFCLLIFIYI